MQIFNHSDSDICPVNAWRRYVEVHPLSPNSPAFMLDFHTPLTPMVVVKVMKDALLSYPDVDLDSITMHSLRRGAAQSAESNGAPLAEIMKRGAWKSKADIKPYLTS